MATKKFFHVYAFVIVLFACFLKGNSAENGQISEIKNSEVKTTVSEETTDEIVPGEVAPAANKEATKEGQEVGSEDGEKTLRIKKGDDGKTTDDGKNETTSNGENGNGKRNGQDVNESEKEDTKLDEKKQEEQEAGLALKILDDDNFEHLTQAATGATTGDWLVLFTKKDCEQCNDAEKEMKIVHERVKHKLNVAKVEEGYSSRLTFKRFGIENLPNIFLFHHEKKYLFKANQSVDEMLHFLNGDYQVASWENVRQPYTFFELFVEESVEELKHMLRYKKNVSLIIFLAGFTVGIFLTSICSSIVFNLLENFKDDEDDEMCARLEQEQPIKSKAE